MLVFLERGKPEYPEKNLLEQRREPTTNSTHICCRRQDSNPGHIGERRALSSLHHPLPMWCDYTNDTSLEVLSHGTIKIVYSCEFVVEILWCDHLNETSSVVLSRGSIKIVYSSDFWVCW